MGLDQCNSLGDYGGPHTASSTFLIIIVCVFRDVLLHVKDISRLKPIAMLVLQRKRTVYLNSCS